MKTLFSFKKRDGEAFGLLIVLAAASILLHVIEKNLFYQSEFLTPENIQEIMNYHAWHVYTMTGCVILFGLTFALDHTLFLEAEDKYVWDFFQRAHLWLLGIPALASTLLFWTTYPDGPGMILLFFLDLIIVVVMAHLVSEERGGDIDVSFDGYAVPALGVLMYFWWRESWIPQVYLLGISALGFVLYLVNRIIQFSDSVTQVRARTVSFIVTFFLLGAGYGVFAFGNIEPKTKLETTKYVVIQKRTLEKKIPVGDIDSTGVGSGFSKMDSPNVVTAKTTLTKTLFTGAVLTTYQERQDTSKMNLRILTLLPADIRKEVNKKTDELIVEYP